MFMRVSETIEYTNDHIKVVLEIIQNLILSNKDPELVIISNQLKLETNSESQLRLKATIERG